MQGINRYDLIVVVLQMGFSVLRRHVCKQSLDQGPFHICHDSYMESNHKAYHMQLCSGITRWRHLGLTKSFCHFEIPPLSFKGVVESGNVVAEELFVVFVLGLPTLLAVANLESYLLSYLL